MAANRRNAYKHPRHRSAKIDVAIEDIIEKHRAEKIRAEEKKFNQKYKR